MNAYQITYVYVGLKFVLRLKCNLACVLCA